MKNFIEVGKTEEEQVEQIKKWVKDNGMQIFAGIAIGLSGIWGMDAYKSYQNAQSLEARTLYLNVAINPNNSKALEQLSAEHEDSGYLEQANLLLAKNAVNNKNYTQALEYLAPLNASNNNQIAKIATLRTASLHLEMGNFKQALEVLNSASSGEFNGLYNQLKGDIYLADNQTDNAKKHYQLALKQISQDSKLRNLISIKLNDLN